MQRAHDSASTSTSNADGSAGHEIAPKRAFDRSAYKLFPDPPSATNPPDPKPPPSTPPSRSNVRRSISLDESGRSKMLPTPRPTQAPGSGEVRNEHSPNVRAQAHGGVATKEEDLSRAPTQELQRQRSMSVPVEQRPARDVPPVPAQMSPRGSPARYYAAAQQAGDSARPTQDEVSLRGVQVDKLLAAGIKPPSPAAELQVRARSSSNSSPSPVGLGLSFRSNATTPDLAMFPAPGRPGTFVSRPQSPGSVGSRSQSPNGYGSQRPRSPHGNPNSRPQSPNGYGMSRPQSPSRTIPYGRPQSPSRLPLMRPQSPYSQPPPRPHSPNGFQPRTGSPLGNDSPRSQSPRPPPGRMGQSGYTPTGMGMSRMAGHDLRVDTSISAQRRMPPPSATYRQMYQHQRQNTDYRRQIQGAEPMEEGDVIPDLPPQLESSRSLSLLRPSQSREQSPAQLSQQTPSTISEPTTSETIPHTADGEQASKKAIRKSRLQKALPPPPPRDSLLPPDMPQDIAEESSGEDSQAQSPVSANSSGGPVSPVSPMYSQGFGYSNVAANAASLPSPVSAITTLDFDVPIDAPAVPPVPKAFSRKPLPAKSPVATQLSTASPHSPPLSPPFLNLHIDTAPLIKKTPSPHEPSPVNTISPQSSISAKSSRRSESPVRLEKARSVQIQPLERPSSDQTWEGHARVASIVASVRSGDDSTGHTRNVSLVPSLIDLKSPAELRRPQVIKEVATPEEAEDAVKVGHTGQETRQEQTRTTQVPAHGYLSPMRSPNKVDSQLPEPIQAPRATSNEAKAKAPAAAADVHEPAVKSVSINKPEVVASRSMIPTLRLKSSKARDLISRIEQKVQHDSSRLDTGSQGGKTPKDHSPTPSIKAQSIKSASRENVAIMPAQNTPPDNATDNHDMDGANPIKATAMPTSSVQPSLETTVNSTADSRLQDMQQVVPSETQSEKVFEKPEVKPAPQAEIRPQQQYSEQGSTILEPAETATAHDVPSLMRDVPGSVSVPKQPTPSRATEQAPTTSPPSAARIVAMAQEKMKALALRATPAEAPTAHATPEKRQDTAPTQALSSSPLLLSKPAELHEFGTNSSPEEQIPTDQSLVSPQAVTPVRISSKRNSPDVIDQFPKPTTVLAEIAATPVTAPVADILKDRVEVSAAAIRANVSESPARGGVKPTLPTAKQEPVKKVVKDAAVTTSKIPVGSDLAPGKSKLESSSAYKNFFMQEDVFFSIPDMSNLPSGQLASIQEDGHQEEPMARKSSSTMRSIPSKISARQMAREERPSGKSKTVESSASSIASSHWSKDDRPSSSRGESQALLIPGLAPFARDDRPSSTDTGVLPANENIKISNMPYEPQASGPAPTTPATQNIIPSEIETAPTYGPEKLDVVRPSPSTQARPISEAPPPVPRKDTIRRPPQKRNIPPVALTDPMPSAAALERHRGHFADVSRNGSQGSVSSINLDAIRARVAGLSERTAKAIEAPSKDETSLLSTLEELAQQSETLHERYAGLRADRQRLTNKMSAFLRDVRPGPGYVPALMDQHAALAAVMSSMDICFAKLKSLDCRKEEAIAALMANVHRKPSSASVRPRGLSSSQQTDVSRGSSNATAILDLAGSKRDADPRAVQRKPSPQIQAEPSPRALADTSASAGSTPRPAQASIQTTHTIPAHRTPVQRTPVQTPMAAEQDGRLRVKGVKAAKVLGLVNNQGEPTERDVTLPNPTSDQNSRLVVTIGSMKGAKTPPPSRPLPTPPPTRRRSVVDSMHASVMSLASTPEDPDIWTPGEEEITPNVLKGAGLPPARDVRVYADDDFLDYYRTAP